MVLKMKSICNKCKHLWSREGTYYCTWNGLFNVRYTKTKKGCRYFEEGENVKKYIKQGWWRRK